MVMEVTQVEGLNGAHVWFQEPRTADPTHSSDTGPSEPMTSWLDRSTATSNCTLSAPQALGELSAKSSPNECQ